MLQQKAQKNTSIFKKFKLQRKQIAKKLPTQVISKYVTESCEKYMQQVIEPQDIRFSTYSCFIGDCQPQPQSHIITTKNKIPIIQLNTENKVKNEKKVSKKGIKMMSNFKKQNISVQKTKGRTNDCSPEKNFYPLQGNLCLQMDQKTSPSLRNIDMLRVFKHRRIFNSEDQFGKKEEEDKGQSGQKQKNTTMPYTYGYTGNTIPITPNQNIFKDKTNVVEVGVKVVEKNDESDGSKMVRKFKFYDKLVKKQSIKGGGKRQSFFYKPRHKQLEVYPQNTQFLINFCKMNFNSHTIFSNSKRESLQKTQSINIKSTMRHSSKIKTHPSKSKSLSLLDFVPNRCCVNVADKYLLYNELLYESSQNIANSNLHKQNEQNNSGRSSQMKRIFKTGFIEA